MNEYSTSVASNDPGTRLPSARLRVVGEFMRFGVVGVVGFLVDVGVLKVALSLGLGPWFGRIISYVAAASTTFALNRAWTFRSRQAGGQDSAGRVGRQWAVFLMVNLVGFAFNFGTYAALLAASGLVARHPELGVAAGSIAGMAGNFLLSRRFVFGRTTPQNPLAGA